MEIIPYLFSRCLIFLAEDVFIMVISFPVRKKFRGGLTLHEYRSLSSVVTKTDSTCGRLIISNLNSTAIFVRTN